MPVSSPESTMPTLRPFVCGVENWAAMGIKICGTTEHTPVTNEAASMTRKSEANEMVNSDITSKTKFTSMMRLRRNMSPNGMMKNNPKAYPAWENMATMLA